MRISMSCAAILAYVVIGHPPPAVAQVDQQRAQEYFKEAQALCERDGGRLWGVSLCGPMVIADAATGTIATSEPAPAGDRPRAIGFVNAPVQWGGITWSAYIWEMVIPKDDRGERGRLFMHELQFDLVVWIGDMDDSRRRELYRPACLTVDDVAFLVIEPPDINYPWLKEAASESTRGKVSLPGVQAHSRTHRRAPGRLGCTSEN
jgi:hypothetical protein